MLLCYNCPLAVRSGSKAHAAEADETASFEVLLALYIVLAPVAQGQDQHWTHGRCRDLLLSVVHAEGVRIASRVLVSPAQEGLLL